MQRGALGTTTVAHGLHPPYGVLAKGMHGMQGLGVGVGVTPASGTSAAWREGAQGGGEGQPSPWYHAAAPANSYRKTLPLSTLLTLEAVYV